MKKRDRKKLNSQPAAESFAELFRRQYRCYENNPHVIMALVNHQLARKMDLAVRAHILKCQSCRVAYSALRVLKESNKTHSLAQRESVANALAGNGHSVPSEPTKRCPGCERLLPLMDFGKSGSRRPKLNLFCKHCVRAKIAKSRQTPQEQENVQALHNQKPLNAGGTKSREATNKCASKNLIEQQEKKSPIDRVREAINSGAQTQSEIAKSTNLTKDKIRDALANLLLWTKEIRSEVINHSRLYFIIDAEDETVDYDREKTNYAGSEVKQVLICARKRSVIAKVKVKTNSPKLNRRSGT